MAIMKQVRDPRLDRLAAALDRDEESPHGWSYRVQEADSFGPGHLVVWWKTDDMTAEPTEIDIKRTVRGARVVREDASRGKRVEFLPEPFNSIIARLEQRIREGKVPATPEEFTAFLGLREVESCKTSTM